MEAKKFKPSLSLFVCFAILLLSLLSTTAIAGKDFHAMAMLGKTIVPSPWPPVRSLSYCTWKGVQCDSTHRVSEIDLDSMGLRAIPSEFPSLPQLKILRLSHNSLSGSFPSLGSLTSLEELFLENNNFSSIPPGFFTELASTLRVLDLSDNPFLPSWSIPTGLTRFEGLAGRILRDGSLIFLTLFLWRI